MKADNPLITSLTIPSNAGPGQPRIVISGNTITGYYADNRIGWQCTVDPTATIVSNSDDALPSVAALLNGFFVSSFAGDLNTFTSCYILQPSRVDGTMEITNIDASSNFAAMDLGMTVSNRSTWYPGLEARHSVTPGTGWSVSAGTLRNAPPVNYWVDATDTLHIRGAMSISNTGTLSSTAFVLQADHTPVASWNLQQDYIYQQSSAGGQKGPAHLFISGSNVSVNNLSAVAVGDILNFNHTFTMGYKP